MEPARILIVTGVLLLLTGGIWYIAAASGLPPWLRQLGNLPGDIRVEKEHFRFYFPVTTMLLISIVVNLLFRLFRYIFG